MRLSNESWKWVENNLKMVTLGECFARLGWLIVMEDRAFVRGFNQGLDEGVEAARDTDWEDQRF